MTKVLIDHGAVPNFVKLLVSPSDDVREEAVMALGNIASEFPTWRDLVLGHSALAPLQAMLNKHTKLSTLRLATWTLSKLCWGNPEPWFKQTSFWKFDGADFTYLSELFLHSSSSVLTPTLQNVETDDLQTQVPHDIEQNPDDGIIAIMKSLTEATQRSITLTLPDIQTLIYEQTRYAGAFFDPPSGGTVMGRLSFSINGGFPTNDKKCMRGIYIPMNIDEVMDMSSDALFILLVDRDDIYVTLDHLQFWDRFPCIIVNLRGRPCVFTWLFVWKMKIELKLPVLALVDGAPYNLKKLSVYGSHNMLYDVKWLGFRPTDWDKHKIPEQFRVPMDDRDIKDCKDLLEDDFVKKNPRRVEELELMLKLKQKVEVETLYFHRGDYLTDVFLPQKLPEQDWL